MNVSPDILIIPSKLVPFAKEINGTLVINPGPLAKGNGGGTYAEVTVHPMKHDGTEDQVAASISGNDNEMSKDTTEKQIFHDVCSRSAVEIIRI